MASVKRQENVAKNGREENKITDFFRSGTKQNDVIEVECLFTAFLVEHNLPLSSADHMGPVLRRIFRNNEVAMKYGCARTKTSAIIEEYSKEAISKLVKSLKTVFFHRNWR